MRVLISVLKSGALARFRHLGTMERSRRWLEGVSWVRFLTPSILRSPSVQNLFGCCLYMFGPDSGWKATMVRRCLQAPSGKQPPSVQNGLSDSGRQHSYQKAKTKIKEIENKKPIHSLLAYFELVIPYTSLSATISAAPATNATNAESMPGT